VLWKLDPNEYNSKQRTKEHEKWLAAYGGTTGSEQCERQVQEKIAAARCLSAKSTDTAEAWERFLEKYQDAGASSSCVEQARRKIAEIEAAEAQALAELMDQFEFALGDWWAYTVVDGKRKRDAFCFTFSAAENPSDRHHGDFSLRECACDTACSPELTAPLRWEASQKKLYFGGSSKWNWASRTSSISGNKKTLTLAKNSGSVVTLHRFHHEHDADDVEAGMASTGQRSESSGTSGGLLDRGINAAIDQIDPDASAATREMTTSAVKTVVDPRAGKTEEHMGNMIDAAERVGAGE